MKLMDKLSACAASSSKNGLMDYPSLKLALLRRVMWDR
jgi:hypothetical protein